MKPILPPAPPALIKLRELNDRWGQVVDWWFKATADIYTARTIAFERSMRTADHKKRAEQHVTICERHAARLIEIEKTEEAFKEAFDAVRKTLDSNEILEYSCLISPIIREYENKESAKRDALRLQKSREKMAFNKEKEDKKRKRLSNKIARRISGEERTRDRNLSQADRTSEAPDEGTGGGTLTDD